MTRKPLTLSIIIPAYNEQRHLRECLDAIANQTVMPDEVIVVDNNSTDNTYEIASSYPFVRVVHEKRQGLIAARNQGLNSAKSDLLARIDADAIIEPDWVEVARKQFEDDETHSITGPARTSMDIHLPWWQTLLWSRLYFVYALSKYRVHVLWGPNMVMRKTVWEAIKNQASTKDLVVHEDQDLSVLTRLNGFTIRYVPKLIISTDQDRYASVRKTLEYYRRCHTTLLLHRLDLGKIEKDISFLKAKILVVALIPSGIVLTLMLLVNDLEKKLGVRKVS